MNMTVTAPVRKTNDKTTLAYSLLTGSEIDVYKTDGTVVRGIVRRLTAEDGSLKNWLVLLHNNLEENIFVKSH